MQLDELKLLIYESMMQKEISESVGHQMLDILYEGIGDITASKTGGAETFVLYGKDRAEIMKQVDIACKKVYNKDVYQNNIRHRPRFKSIKKSKNESILEIFLGGMTEDEFYSGHGISFQGEVARHLNSVPSLSRYDFSSEDYPGIWITLK